MARKTIDRALIEQMIQEEKAKENSLSRELNTSLNRLLEGFTCDELRLLKIGFSHTALNDLLTDKRTK